MDSIQGLAPDKNGAGQMRLDAALVARGFFTGRDRAKEAIAAGRVCVNGRAERKASAAVLESADITLADAGEDYASRAGGKLAHALNAFDIDCTGLVCLDAGAAAGGFTDCLLRRGARHVYAVDVGHGQLAAALRADVRVTSMEATDIRTLTPSSLGCKPALAVGDLSFISLSHVMPALRGLLAEDGQAVLLVKPQFEAGRGRVGARGVVRDARTHVAVLQKCMRDAQLCGFGIVGLTHAALRGREGNIEFLMHVTCRQQSAERLPDAAAVVRTAHRLL